MDENELLPTGTNNTGSPKCEQCKHYHPTMCSNACQGCSRFHIDMFALREGEKIIRNTKILYMDENKLLPTGTVVVLTGVIRLVDICNEKMPYLVQLGDGQYGWFGKKSCKLMEISEKKQIKERPGHELN